MFGWLHDLADTLERIPRHLIRARLEWETKVITRSSTHHMPEDDGYEHIVDDCPYGPWIENIATDGRLDWMVHHHAMDGSDAQFVEDNED